MNPPPSENAEEVMRYGFNLDRDYFLEYTNSFKLYLSIINAFTIHPLMWYLLLFKCKNMARDVRIGYILYQIGHITIEWSFSIAFRPYFIFPYDAIYCDGPLCRMGLPKQLLMICFVVCVLFGVIPFEFILLRMHQSFTVINGAPPMKLRWQILLSIGNAICISLIILSWALFARDCDDASVIMKEREIQWLIRRGGTIFMFGRSGNAQYFQYAIYSIFIVAALLLPVFFTIFSQIITLVKEIRKKSLNGNTEDMSKRMFVVASWQMHTAIVMFLFPIFTLCIFTLIDTTDIPGIIYAPMRSFFLILFSINSTQASLLFILKNPIHMKEHARDYASYNYPRINVHNCLDDVERHLT